jgi:hypothetical protein
MEQSGGAPEGPDPPLLWTVSCVGESGRKELMMQKPIAIAAVLGALIIAAALVYHGRQLAEVSRRLEAMEHRTTDLNGRLEKFSSELPTLVGQAGNNAGREAVHGMVDEVVQMPLKWLRSKPATGGSNASTHTVSPPRSGGATADEGAPWVRFNIREPVIKIEILPNLKEVPAIPWPSDDGRKRLLVQTNAPGSSGLGPTPDAEAKQPKRASKER